jgi:hypothetical protein
MESLAVPADTSLEAFRVQIEVLRRIGPAGRARMTFELSEAAREAAKAGIRSRHPDYTEDQVRYALFRLTLGRTLFEKAFPGVNVEP